MAEQDFKLNLRRQKQLAASGEEIKRVLSTRLTEWASATTPKARGGSETPPSFTLIYQRLKELDVRGDRIQNILTSGRKARHS